MSQLYAGRKNDIRRDWSVQEVASRRAVARLRLLQMKSWLLASATVCDVDPLEYLQPVRPIGDRCDPFETLDKPVRRLIA